MVGRTRSSGPAGDYYPKLQVAVPFSPVPGPRLLVRPGVPPEAMGQALVQACRELDLSSVHATFCTEAEWEALGRAGWLLRQGKQFHWENAGYADFDGFLAALSSRKRKSIKRERRDAKRGRAALPDAARRRDRVAALGCVLQVLYLDLGPQMGSAYLTRSFFPILSERLGDRVVLMMAESDGRLVAGALNLMGDEALYGRNWGCRGDWPFLHFELCYYRAIDFAIAHGLQRVEAGAQGEHKIQRGYLPKPTYSAHWIAHAGLREAVSGFLEQERRAIAREMAMLEEYSPFRQEGE